MGQFVFFSQKIDSLCSSFIHFVFQAGGGSKESSEEDSEPERQTEPIQVRTHL
jgi:hypothetical protein